MFHFFSKTFNSLVDGLKLIFHQLLTSVIENLLSVIGTLLELLKKNIVQFRYLI